MTIPDRPQRPPICDEPDQMCCHRCRVKASEMTAASLAVAMIGHALAQARGLVTKHAVKQMDRLRSNNGFDVWDSFVRWVPHQIGGRQDILVAMDWTGFDRDDQATLVLGLVTSHRRAASLLWLTVWKEELHNRRNDYEDACLRRLSELVPPGCHVTILADRGFGDQKLFACLGELGFDYVIRFRGTIHVTDADGQARRATDWVGKGRRPSSGIPAACAAGTLASVAASCATPVSPRRASRSAPSSACMPKA